MGAFEIRWLGARHEEGGRKDLGRPLVVHARDWMDALGLALQRYGVGRVALERAVCLLHADGTIDVTDPDSNTRFAVRQVEGDEELEDPPSLDQASVFDQFDDIDAPDPVMSLAHRAQRGGDPRSLERLAQDLALLGEGLVGEELCATVLDLLLREIPAESASVLLAAPAGRGLRFVAVRGPAAPAVRALEVPPGRGIASLVMRTGTSLLVGEVASNPDHYATIDQAVGYRTRSLLAVPIRGSVYCHGVIELLNPFGGGSFGEGHRKAAELAAGRIASGLGA